MLNKNKFLHFLSNTIKEFYYRIKLLNYINKLYWVNNLYFNFNINILKLKFKNLYKFKIFYFYLTLNFLFNYFFIFKNLLNVNNIKNINLNYIYIFYNDYLIDFLNIKVNKFFFKFFFFNYFNKKSNFNILFFNSIPNLDIKKIKKLFSISNSILEEDNNLKLFEIKNKNFLYFRFYIFNRNISINKFDFLFFFLLSLYNMGIHIYIIINIILYYLFLFFIFFFRIVNYFILQISKLIIIKNYINNTTI